MSKYYIDGLGYFDNDCQKPPISDRGVTFSPPSDNPPDLSPCCQAKQQINFYDKWAQWAFDNSKSEALHTYNACYGQAVTDFEKLEKCEQCLEWYLEQL